MRVPRPGLSTSGRKMPLRELGLSSTKLDLSKRIQPGYTSRAGKTKWQGKTHAPIRDTVQPAQPARSSLARKPPHIPRKVQTVQTAQKLHIEKIDHLEKTENMEHIDRFEDYLPRRRKRTPGQARLTWAMILLVLVFILGMSHGVNSLLHGSEVVIESDVVMPDYVDIHGKIIDNSTGRPIMDCKVTILETGQAALSNVDGQYFITNVKAGVHEISAEADGYIKEVKKVTVDPELLGIIDFALEGGAGVKNKDESVDMEKDEKAEINAFAIFIILFAGFGLLGAVLVFKRNFFWVCVFCSFISLLSIGMGVGIVLGLLALILVLVSRQEFEGTKITKTKI